MTNKGYRFPVCGLYIVTDRNLSRHSVVDTVRYALEGGATVVQYREKELSTRSMIETGMALRKLTQKYRALLIINDRVDVALAVGADGVHLGQDDMPYTMARQLMGQKCIIGVTVHSVKEALTAKDLGADYLGVSPIFSTSTKKDAGSPGGIKLIIEIKKAVDAPLVAIGGINELNLPQVLATGIRNVAMISAVVTKNDVKATVQRIQKKILG